MKVKKLTESVFEKLRSADAVMNPVMADAVNDHDERQDYVRKIMDDRMKAFQDLDKNSTKAQTPKEIPVNEQLSEAMNEGRDVEPDVFDFWTTVYGELIDDSSFNNTTTRDNHRELPDPDPKMGKRGNKEIKLSTGRYTDEDFNITPDGDIKIYAATPEKLDFARKVAEHYGVRTQEFQLRYSGQPYGITLYVSEKE